MDVRETGFALCRLGVVAALLAVMGGIGPARAVNKCIDADNRVTYTDGPCSSGSRGTRVETPPPPSREMQMDALSRSDSLVREARALETRRAQEAAERRRVDEELRQIEQLRQRQAEREESERQARMATVPLYAAPIYPAYPRYRPPVVAPAPARPPAPAPALARPYPFR